MYEGYWKIIMELEGVQLKLIRLIQELGKMSYEKRLKELGIATFLERHICADLIETFKIHSKLVDCGQMF